MKRSLLSVGAGNANEVRKVFDAGDAFWDFKHQQRGRKGYGENMFFKTMSGVMRVIFPVINVCICLSKETIDVKYIFAAKALFFAIAGTLQVFSDFLAMIPM